VSLLALLVDYGGVLTNDIADCVDEFCLAENIEPALYDAVMSEWLGDEAAALAHNPVALLERGEMSEDAFERELAARLQTRTGELIAAAGLLHRMFAGTRREPMMVSVVRRARAAGIRTALLSNSWHMDVYDRATWDEIFDAIVISGDVGMRKPDADIYLHTAALLGVGPTECVFVDDLAVNVRGAAAVGMVGILHVSAEATAAEVDALFYSAFLTRLRGG